MVKPFLFLLLALLLPGSASAQKLDFRHMKRGRWKPQHVPRGFFAKRYKRYQFQSDWDKQVVLSLARHMNRMFKVYWKFAPPKKTPTDLLVVKLFKNRREFLAYGSPPGAAAYYSPRDREMVGYNTGMVAGRSTIPAATGQGLHLRRRMRRASSMDVLGVFSHEGWHQYFHWACGSKIPFPAWLDEGIGDFFYTAYPDKSGKIVLGAPMDGRLRTIQAAIRAKRSVPLEKMVHFEQRDYYRNAGQNYAQGWSMVHFFMEHPRYKKARLAQHFVKIFVDQHSIKKTVARVFPKHTHWDRLEHDWKNWVLATPLEINPDDPRVAAAMKANREARKVFEKLPANVQQALKTCVDKRSARPGAISKTPSWMNPAKKDKRLPSHASR